MTEQEVATNDKFSTFALAPDVLESLEQLGMEDVTPIQAKVIGPILEGKDVVGKAETGTGKTIGFAAPTGQKLDDRWGDPTQLKISSSPEELLLEGAGTSTGLHRTLRLNPEVEEGVLHITARAAACDGEKGQPIPDHAACHLYQQDWGIPVTVHTPDRAPEGAETRLDLDLRGIH